MLGILVLVPIGAGIYVSHVISSNTWSNSYGHSGPQPANSYAIVDTGYGTTTRHRLVMYCCSNLSSSTHGKITFPDGYTTSGSSSVVYGKATIFHHNGCRYFHYYYNPGYYLTLLYSGVYTCSIDDSNGNNIDIHIGLYEEGFNSKHNGS